jgi:hypothetical protein
MASRSATDTLSPFSKTRCFPARPQVFWEQKGGRGQGQALRFAVGGASASLDRRKAHLLLGSQSAWPVGFVPGFGFRQRVRAGSTGFSSKILIH